MKRTYCLQIITVKIPFPVLALAGAGNFVSAPGMAR